MDVPRAGAGAMIDAYSPHARQWDGPAAPPSEQVSLRGAIPAHVRVGR